MKFRLILLFVLGFGLSAQAQLDNVVKSAVPHKDPFYIQITTGPNHSMSENTDMWESSHEYGFRKRTVKWFYSLGVGSEFTNVLGWRLTASYNGNRGANNWYGTGSSRYFDNNNPSFYSYKNFDGFADLTVDLLDLFRPNRISNRFDLKGFVGVGAAYVYDLPEDDLNGDNYPFSDDNGLHWGLHVGLRAGYFVTKNLELGAELTLNGFDDKYSGYKYDFPMDLRQNLGVFLAFNFSKDKEVVTPVVVEPTPEPVVVETPIEYSPSFLFITPNAEGCKHRELNGSAFLDFVVDKTNINPTYRRNTEELAKIRSSIDVVKNDPTLTITSIGIHGYASPESPYNHNADLAKGRAESLRQYLLNVYKMDGKVITSTYTAEDWDGLRKAVAEGNYDHKDAILAIIDGPLTPDPKEWKLKSTYPEVYKVLRAEVYPALRHSDYTIKYDVRDYTLEESKQIIKTNPENLSQCEMFAVAQSYGKGTEGYKDALLTAVKVFPNDETANLNVASMYLDEGNVDEAEKYLDKLGNTADANYVKGVAAAMQKNYDKAKTYFKAAEIGGQAMATEALKQITK